MSSLHVVREVLVELEPNQLRFPPRVMDLLRDGRRDPGLGHRDAVSKGHPQPAQPPQLLVLDRELRQRGRLDPPPLGPILLVPTPRRGLVVPLPREDRIVEAGRRELAVWPRPAAVEQVAEALGAVGRSGGRGSGGGGIVVVGGEAEVAEAVDDAVDGGGGGRGGRGGRLGGVGGRPLLQPRSAGAGNGWGGPVAAGGGRGGGRGGGGGGGVAGAEEAEGEEAVEVGPGGEAEGVVERELGERHGGGERRAERRLGGLARWRHGWEIGRAHV